MRAEPFAFVALVVVTLVACGGSESGIDRGNNLGGGGSGTGAAGASSTSEEKSGLCTALVGKGCDLTTEERQNCETNLAGLSSAFVQAMKRCVDAASACDDLYEECGKKALPEIAPGYPNVPVVTRCKDKNLECVTKYAPNSTDKDNSIKRREIDDACETLPALDQAGQNRAEECRSKECDAFAACLNDVAPDLD